MKVLLLSLLLVGIARAHFLCHCSIFFDAFNQRCQPQGPIRDLTTTSPTVANCSSTDSYECADMCQFAYEQWQEDFDNDDGSGQGRTIGDALCVAAYAYLESINRNDNSDILTELFAQDSIGDPVICPIYGDWWRTYVLPETPYRHLCCRGADQRYDKSMDAICNYVPPAPVAWGP